VQFRSWLSGRRFTVVGQSCLWRKEQGNSLAKGWFGLHLDEYEGTLAIHHYSNDGLPCRGQYICRYQRDDSYRQRSSMHQTLVEGHENARRFAAGPNIFVRRPSNVDAHSCDGRERSGRHRDDYGVDSTTCFGTGRPRTGMGHPVQYRVPRDLDGRFAVPLLFEGSTRFANQNNRVLYTVSSLEQQCSISLCSLLLSLFFSCSLSCCNRAEHYNRVECSSNTCPIVPVILGRSIPK
jgi:hypothetical protein